MHTQRHTPQIRRTSMKSPLLSFCVGSTTAYISPKPFTSPQLNTALTTANNLSSNQHIRILKRGKHYDIQTSVTSFKKRSITDAEEKEVDLHSQIHFADESYFNYYSSMNYDAVLYELLVGEEMLTLQNSFKCLKPVNGMNPIQPTQSDRNIASQYGLTCQVDGINYCREGWIHADLSREEFLDVLHQGQEQQQKQDDRPLWALASTSPTNALQEGISSLINPPTSTSNTLSRRLFSHLFLPGSSFAILLRSLLWIVPSPELSILLVDWSTISSKTSEIAIPVLISLLSGRWGAARRLVFGQVLAGGAGEEDGSKNGVLIEKRNQRAIDVLKAVQQNCKGKVALLYGSGHCQDLSRRLMQEGYVPVKKEWRTAFRATPPNLGDFYLDVQDWKRLQRQKASSGEDVSSWTLQSIDASTLESVAVSLVILPLYLMLGGFDWVATISQLSSAVDSGSYVDGFAAALVYLVRHVALYVAISKFVVDWGGKGGVFTDEEAN